MLTKELEELERRARTDVNERRRLGGFDVNAGIILRLTERQLELITHLIKLAKLTKLTKQRKR